MKRKIDIRADLKDVKENIKENENLNIQRNKDIKETLEELKFKIKGYSAKKERKLKEIENLEGKKLEFKDELSKDIDKKEIINLDENVEENNIEPEVKEKEKEDKKEILKSEEKEDKKEIKNIKDNKDEKEEKIIEKKR